MYKIERIVDNEVYVIDDSFTGFTAAYRRMVELSKLNSTAVFKIMRLQGN